MKMETSYKQIFTLSVPIMLGSAAQNIIVLSDTVFLFHYNSVDFAASGLVGVFYLIIASIGYGFSRGGQIIMARRNGEGNYRTAGLDFQSLVVFELLLSILLFLILYFFSRSIFSFFVKDPLILDKCVEYIQPRSYGVFFSYVGVSMIAFYTAIAKTKFIIVDTLVLIVVNLALNYVFIFGKFGLPQMGIKGAAWASTIAEMVAFIVFVLYIMQDKTIFKYHWWNPNRLSLKEFKTMNSISMPIVFQSILGIGSWFLFFSFIENIGKKELEISNLLRTVYLILSIPCWGYSAGINTLVSNFIGSSKRQAVIPIILKTIKLSLATTLLIALPVVLFPELFLYPLFGKEDMTLILASKPYLVTVLLILIVFNIGGVVFNGLIGTGYTDEALKIQTIFTILYILYAYIFTKVYYFGLHWAWAAEIIYWVGITALSIIYLKSRKWHILKL